MPIIEEISYNAKTKTIRDNVIIPHSRHKTLRIALTKMIVENMVRPRKSYGSWADTTGKINGGPVFKITDYSYNDRSVNPNHSPK